MSNHTYAATHAHPTHIDIPAVPLARSITDEPDALDGGVLGEDGGVQDGGQEPTTPSAARPPPARGILKNPLRRPSQIGPGDQPATDAERVQWDEKNLAETEIGKDSLMKIDEPKTPYVWGDPEKDMSLTDVPDFDLQSAHSSSPARSTDRRPSMTSSSRSGSSSRSASFSLPSKDKPVRPGSSSSSGRRSPSSDSPAGAHLITPNPADGDSTKTSAMAPGEGHEVAGMAMGATSANTAANAQRPRVGDGDGMDGEESGEVFSDSDEEMDEEAKAKHMEFKGKRKEHYAQEAKLALERAKELLRQDEAAGDSGEDVMEVDGN